MLNDAMYDSDIEKQILLHLDGWRIGDNAITEQLEEEIAPFMTTEEIVDKANKVITSDECTLVYEETLDSAYAYTNRLNLDDLSKIEKRIFIRAVCKWTASNLWNKYNIRVSNEDMEDTYTSSYGGLLYKSALKTLDQFILQRIMGLHKKEDNNNDSVWSV